LTTPTYRTGTFARRARVSVRTLRFYDREGLLTPSAHSDSGHRLYSDEDLITLQKILAMKLLGFTLAEIRAFLGSGSADVPQALVQQRTMLCEHRDRVDQAIRLIDQVSAGLRTGGMDWEALLRVIEVMQMNEDRTWVHKHLTPEQIEAIGRISAHAYSPEASERLAGREWTEADQIRVTQAWAEVYADAERLANAGADPAGPEGRALAERYRALIQEFTQGDPEVEAGLGRFYQEARELPPEQSPYQAPPAAREFAERAYEALKP